MNFTHIIFKAFDLPHGITSTPKLIAHHPLEIYFCVSNELTQQLLFQDQLNYLATRQKQAVDRRVAFILEHAMQVIVIVEYKDIDPFVCNSLLDSLNATSDRDKPAPIDEKQKEKLKRLYTHVHCFIITTAADPKALSQQFVLIFQEMYPAIKIEVHPIQAEQHRDIAFTEYVLQLLTATQVKTVNIQSAYTSYQIACAKKIQHSLSQWQTLLPNALKKINTLITILLKYDVILKQRVSITLSQPTIAQLEALQTKDQLFKKMIYRSPIKEIQPYIKDLPLTLLMALVADESVDHWIANLKGFRQQQLSQLKMWEQALKDVIKKQKQHYLNYISWLSKKLWYKVYHHSFIGLGAECSQWLALRILDTKASADGFKHLQKLTGERINKSHVLQFTKVLGVIPGSFYYYAIGSYGLFRTLGSSLLGEQLTLFLGNEKVNDKKALVISPTLPLPSVINFTRIAQVLLALFEAVFFQNHHFLGQAIGRLTGSIILVELFKCIFPHLQTASMEQQIILLLFFSLCGSEIGSFSANVVCDGIDKLSTRALLEEAVCEKVAENGYIGCTVDYCKQSMNSFSFWFSKNDAMRLSSTKKNSYYETDCQVVSMDNENYLVDCESSVMTMVKRLQY